MGEVLLSIAQGVLHAIIIVAYLLGFPAFLFNFAMWIDARQEPGRERDRNAYRWRFVVHFAITVAAVNLSLLLKGQP